MLRSALVRRAIILLGCLFTCCHAVITQPGDSTSEGPSVSDPGAGQAAPGAAGADPSAPALGGDPNGAANAPSGTGGMAGPLAPTSPTPLPASPFPSSSCRNGLDATFVQLGERDMARDVEQWKAEFEPARGLGMSGIVVQYSGDSRGGYDDRLNAGPLRALLAAAEALDVAVFLGLYADERWPHRLPAGDWLPPPLDNPVESERLFALCSEFRSCVGWYIPEEIDDWTWGTPQGAERIGGLLAAAVARLRSSFPWRPVAISPFYAEALSPEAYADWWRSVLQRAHVDVLMMQDGGGARGTSAVTIGRLLQALRPALEQNGALLWSVAEVFHQTSGMPIDDAEFAAIPTQFAPLRERLDIEHLHAERVVAFSYLDYMAPQRGPAQQALFQQYMLYCAGMQ